MARLRRQVFSAAMCCAIWLPELVLAPQQGFAENTPPFALGPEERGLLNRITWGADDADAKRLAIEGPARFLDEQLHPPTDDGLPAAISNEIASLTITKKTPAELSLEMRERGQQIKALGDRALRMPLRKENATLSNTLVRETETRALLRDVYSKNQLKEQLTWFWFNHFSVKRKPGIRPFLADYEETAIRPHALGHFKDLLSAVVFHPAMLIYLDNAKNAANHINENYAREFLELHTMGVDGGYTQKDVQELARIFTGITINHGGGRTKVSSGNADHVNGGLFLFDPKRHDNGDKIFLGHVIKSGGLDEIDEVMDIVCHHPATAVYLSRALAVYFVSDSPPGTLVEAMAKTFLATDGDIAAVLHTMFDSAEFRMTLGTKLKDPITYIVSAMRLLYGNAVVTNAMPMQHWLRQLNEPLYARETPDGYPVKADSWSGSGGMATRFAIARVIASGKTALFRRRVEAHPVESMTVKGGPIWADDQPDERAPHRVKLAGTSYVSLVAPTLGAATRSALGNAKTVAEWNMLFLSSPEFMHR